MTEKTTDLSALRAATHLADDSAPHASARSALGGLFDWRRAVIRVPRRHCHYLVLDVGKIPRRYLLSSLRLQLAQLTGLADIGFACLVRDGTARIWYWDEADAAVRDALAVPEGAAGSGIEPCPEPLLRAVPDDGLHLFACADGCEAIAIESGEIRRTRWFREAPDDDTWTAFVRDAGREPAAHARPELRRPARLTHPAKGWKLSSRLIRPVSAQAWAAAAMAALAGAVLIAGGLYEYKLGALIEAEQAEIARIRSENATTIALQNELAGQDGYLAALRAAQPAMLQLNLMKTFAASGLFDDPARISLYEWEYRGGRLRILFAVKEQDSSLSDFLVELEKLPVLGQIRLMPDTSRGTVGIQAAIAALPPVPAAKP